MPYTMIVYFKYIQLLYMYRMYIPTEIFKKIELIIELILNFFFL